jgi:hypothetical protein
MKFLPLGALMFTIYSVQVIRSALRLISIRPSVGMSASLIRKLQYLQRSSAEDLQKVSGRVASVVPNSDS